MPNVAGYKRGFGLSNGMVISGYKLSELNIQHIEIKRYKTYEYPTRMVWKKVSDNANKKALYNEIERKVEGLRTILSGYGNPYECDFGEISVYDDDETNIVMAATGVCHRV